METKASRKNVKVKKRKSEVTMKMVTLLGLKSFKLIIIYSRPNI